MDLNLCYPCLSYLDLLNNSLHIFAEACKYGRLLDTVDKVRVNMIIHHSNYFTDSKMINSIN